MWFQRHEVPRRSIDGMTGVYCQTCGREICRRNNTQFRSIQKCAICVLAEQGIFDAESKILPQYIMFDPTKPPVPIDAEGDSVIVNLFPEEMQHAGQQAQSSGGVAGTAKSIFRAMGFLKPKTVPTESQKVATKRRRESSLFK
jgi:hypothetical protein